MQKIILKTLFVCLLIISLSCANNIQPSKKVSDEEALRERVTQYWQHKINLDLDKAYEFEDPSYRSIENKVRYIRHHNIEMVKWMSAEIVRIELADDKAEVKMKIMVKLLLPGKRAEQAIPVNISEKWIKVDGVWYHRFQHGSLSSGG